MRARGVLCKESVRFSYGDFRVFFYEGRLYPIILRDDGKWWLTNLKEKKRIELFCLGANTIRRYFKPYQPFKKKTKYERWKFKTRN